MFEVTESPTITKKAPHRRRELTAAGAAALLRYDTETGHLYWLANQRGRVKAGTRAGCAITRKGKPAGRVIGIEGVRYREHHVAHLLTHGTWPAEKRTRKASRKVKASTAPIAAVATPAAVTSTPAPIVVPRDLPEISRAAIAAAKPAHRGWLAGLGLSRATT